MAGKGRGNGRDPLGIWQVVKGRKDMPSISLKDRISKFPGKFPFLTVWQWLFLASMIIAVYTRFVGLGDTALFHDEAYYWVWEQHIGPGNLELSFYDHPAGVAYLIYVSTGIFGDSEFGVRAIFAILGVATVFLIYLLGRYLYDERTGAIAAFLLSINFGHIFLSRMAMNDVAATFMFTLILFMFAKAVFERSDKYLMFAGIALGVGFLVKYTVAVIALGFMVFVLAHPKYRKFVLSRTLVYSLIMTAVISLPFWVWNATHDWAGLAYQGGHASPFLGLFIGGDFFANQVWSIVYYPMVWFVAIGVPLTIILIVGMLRIFKFQWKRETIALALGAFFGMVLTYALQMLILTFAFELLFLYAVYLAYKGFHSEKDALVGLAAIVFILFFAFSLGRMFHWVFPAIAPLSILGAVWIPKAYQSVAINRKQATTFAVVAMLSLNFMGAYAINGAYALSNDGEGPDPKSIMSGAWVSSIEGTRDMGIATAEALEDHPGSIVLVPNWVTYSPVDYYLYREGVDVEIYTWIWDYQIGTVWERDVKHMPDDVDRAVIPVYSSNFLGGPDEDTIFGLLCYSPINESGWRWWGSNDQTLFAKTGFDHFVVEEVGRLEYNTSFMWQKDSSVSLPYFIVYGEKRGSENVTVIHDGLKWTCKKADLFYEGKVGKDFLEIFDYESYKED